MRTQGVLRYRPHRLVMSQNSQSIIKDCQEFGSGEPSRGDFGRHTSYKGRRTGRKNKYALGHAII